MSCETTWLDLSDKSSFKTKCFPLFRWETKESSWENPVQETASWHIISHDGKHLRNAQKRPSNEHTFSLQKLMTTTTLFKSNTYIKSRFQRSIKEGSKAFKPACDTNEMMSWKRFVVQIKDCHSFSHTFVVMMRDNKMRETTKWERQQDEEQQEHNTNNLSHNMLPAKTQRVWQQHHHHHDAHSVSQCFTASRNA